MEYCGQIELVLGPMFSGKSTELIRKVKRYEHARKKVLLIKYQHDSRYTQEDAVATHDLTFHKAVKASRILDIKEIYEYDVVAVDEGQFFSDLVEASEKLANQGKIVIVAALDGTFQRKPFGRVLELVPLAERVIKLNAVCVVCYGKANFTKRLVEDDRIELVGGKEAYEPVCRSCFFSNKKDSRVTSESDSP